MKGLRHIYLLFAFVALFHIHALAQSSQEKLHAMSVFETIAQSNAYTESLTSASQNVLPVGIKRVHNNMEVTIAIDKAVFRKDYTELSVFAKVVLPQRSSGGKETALFFGARGIKLSHNGSIIGDATLALMENIEIPFNNGNMSLVLLGDYDSKTGNSNSGTYLSVDCSGFRELGLDVELRFPETLLQKVNPTDGTVNPSDKVVAGHFQTVVEDWNNLLADIDLPSFQICGLDGFVFSLEDIIFDFSDSHNGEGLQFPAGYEQKYMIPGAATLWRGVYARNLEITLPKPFNDSNDKPTRFRASNLLIDDNGITGLFKAANILSFENGNASGWNFSVNSLAVELEANKLIAAGFFGEIGLPVGGEDTKLGYEANIRENNEYLMRVETTDEIDFSIFCATATILPNSWVQLHVVDNRFRPEALLHGKMSVAAKGDVDIDIPALEFRSMHLMTEAPYISIENLGYTGKISLGASSAFTISLDNIALKSTDSGKVELASGVEVTLADGMFAGKTRIAFLASMQDSGGRHKWQFDGVKLDEIGVKADIAEVIALEGKIGWNRNDPVYGEGFYGELAVDVKPVKVAVKMKGCFGAVDGFKYWFLDGSVKLPPPGIPVMGPLKINGFAGAVSQRMIGKGTSRQSNGSVLSSATYYPDKNMGLGLKAAVMLDVGDVASGEACFEIAFSNSGGLNFIGFYGFAQFAAAKMNIDGLSDKYSKILQKEQEYASGAAKLKALKQFEPNEAAKLVSPMPSNMSADIKGTIGIQYDFRNRVFHAQTELYVSIPGGIMTGVGQGGKAGWGVFHISPEEWYMHLGTPDDRLGIMLNLGNIMNIRAGAYMMAGARIPAMPSPPKQVADVLGADLNQLTQGRNIDALSNGKGFAFGADLQVKTGDLTFLILYANFMAGMGFDVMLKDYDGMVCAETGSQIGMDGWYAMGQSYTYLQGELGVKVNLWFLKTKFPIIKGGTAALLQAGLPNPSYFRGYLGVNFNILGGLVKGNMRFKLSIGDECTPVMPGGSPVTMPIISDLAPGSGEPDVSVFSLPQATFTTAVGEQFEAEDDKGVHTYRVQLKSFTIKTEDGQTVNGTLKWNKDKNAVSFQSKEILPPNSNLTARVEVSFETFSNGRWSTVITGGKEAIESKESTFSTGGAPDHIPLENVLYCYPVADQKYFLTRESGKGFVQIKSGQKYLFERGFDYKLKFIAENNQSVSTALTYNEQANRIEFTIPQLANQRRYTLQLVYTPSNKTATTGGGGQAQQVLSEGEDNSVSLENRAAVAGVSSTLEKSILDYSFATSRYGTFREKIESIDTAGKGLADDAGYSYRFLYEVTADEPFDEAELTGVVRSGEQALIRPYAEMEESYFKETVLPLVYRGYPYGNIRLTTRDDQQMGVPPVRSVAVYQPYLDMIANGERPQSFIFPFSYETGIVVQQDFKNLQHLVANNRQSVSNEVYVRFLNNRLPFIKYGKYRAILEYVLPDGTVSSSYRFDFNNFLEFNK